MQEQERQRQRRERSKLGLGLRRTLSRQSSQLGIVKRAKERRRSNKVRSPVLVFYFILFVAGLCGRCLCLVYCMFCVPGFVGSASVVFV